MLPGFFRNFVATRFTLAMESGLTILPKIILWFPYWRKIWWCQTIGEWAFECAHKNYQCGPCARSGGHGAELAGTWRTPFCIRNGRAKKRISSALSEWRADSLFWIDRSRQWVGRYGSYWPRHSHWKGWKDCVWCITKQTLHYSCPGCESYGNRISLGRSGPSNRTFGHYGCLSRAWPSWTRLKHAS